MDDLYIGLDGGGSNTRVRLVSGTGDVLGSGQAGPSNPQASGLEAAEREISLAIQKAFQEAGIDSQPVTAACFGIGGAERADAKRALEKWALATVAARAKIVNDGEILLAAGSLENWGIAVVAGTGSIAWGKTRDGRMARSGGWGYLIGDEGSSFELAREGLRAAVQAADGRGEPTRLLEAILAHWHLNDPLEIIPSVYRAGSRPADLAALAPVVVKVAEEGDPIAHALLVGAGDSLAACALAVTGRLELQDEPIPLALTGGLLLSNDLIRARLLEAFENAGCALGPIELVQDPVAGAVRLARELG